MNFPKWIRKPDDLQGIALKVWKTHAKTCFEAELLDSANVEQFRILCRLLALIDIAGREIEHDGATIASKTGQKRAHPAVGALISAQADAQKLMRVFGLSRRS